MATAIINPKTGTSIETTLTDAQALDVVRRNVSGDFAQSLVQQFDRRGLSDCQWWHVQRLANEHIEKQRECERDRQAGQSSQSNGHAGPPPTKDVCLSTGSFDRINAIFASAKASGLKHPKVRFDMPSDAENDDSEPIAITLSVAGPSARVPGSINVASQGSFDNRDWYGRVVRGDLYQPGKSNTDAVTEVVKRFCEDPAGYAAAYGRRSGNCCFCGLELTDKRSLFAGYGPVCAERWSLPWGAVSSDDNQ